jgi:NitT/TauT family transport system permease protein
VRRSLAINVGRVLLAVSFLAIWQLLVNRGVLDPFVVSSPDRIWHEFRQLLADGQIWDPVQTTLKELFLGYAAGLLIGVAIGLTIGLSVTMRTYFEPFLVFFNAVPRLVLTPIFVALFGFGMLPKVLTVFCVIFVVIALTVAAGTLEIQANLIENARALGARRRDLFKDVYIPGVGVWILASARVAIAISFQAAIVAEFFGASGGLGHEIEVDLTALNATGMYVWILIAGALAFMFDLVLSRVQRRTSVWLL